MAGIDKQDLVQSPVNGLFYTRDGRPVCEDCGTIIPRYRIAPNGFTSQESDKETVRTVDGRTITEKLEKAVCLPCYLDSYERVFPNEPQPEISSELA